MTVGADERGDAAGLARGGIRRRVVRDGHREVQVADERKREALLLGELGVILDAVVRAADDCHVLGRKLWEQGLKSRPLCGASVRGSRDRVSCGGMQGSRAVSAVQSVRRPGHAIM